MADFPDPSPVGNPIMAGITPMQYHGKQRRAVRAAKNPIDRCTIISIFPKEIDEVKHTIEPGKFRIDAGTFENPSILVVGSSSWWKDIDPDQPLLEIPHSSIQVADSVVKDYCNSKLGCDMGDAMPGVFFVLGEVAQMEVKVKYRKKLEEMRIKQDNWYMILVKMADALWARSNNNPIVISDEMRLGARSLHLDDKSWLKDFRLVKLIECKYCGGMRNPSFPICPVCKAIDPAHPLANEIKFAI